jgi:hypothetical protein
VRPIRMMSLHLEISGIPVCQNNGISVGRYSTCPEEPGRLHPGTFSCPSALDHRGDEGCVPRYSGTLVARSMSQKSGTLAISNKRWFARRTSPAARVPHWVPMIRREKARRALPRGVAVTIARALRATVGCGSV